MKINCSNPECRQRVEVDDVLAGQSVPCPACGVVLEIPKSKDIKFSCADPSCSQHIMVDVSEAGRFMKCPTCGKVQRVPGNPPKALGTAAIPRSKPEAPRPGIESKLIDNKSRARKLIVSPLGKLICGWSLGAIIFLLLITGLQHWTKASLPLHIKQISDEIYLHGIGDFRNNQPQIHGNNMLLLKYVSDDVDVVQVDLKTLTTHVVKQIRSISADMGFVWIGWSPSSRYFAYCAKGAKHNQGIFWCDSTTGKELKIFQMDESERAQSGIWLSDNTLVLTADDCGVYACNLSHVVWHGKLGEPGLTKISSCTNSDGDAKAISDHEIAYTDKGGLWAFDFVSGQVAEITDFAGEVLSDLDYSPTTGTYLFTAAKTSNGNQTEICSYAPHQLRRSVLQHNACNGRWIENGKGFLFLDKNTGGSDELNLQTANEAFRPNIFDTGVMNLHSVAVGDKEADIYAITCDERGQSSLVRYDIATRKRADLLQIQAGYHFAYATPPIEATTTNRSGQVVNYYYLCPSHLQPGRKYPVIMDMTSSSRHDHGRDAEFLANCGIYYVSPNRLDITKWGVTPTEDNALAVYDAITNIPNIDPHRIYITGESITTGTASYLVNEYPERWRGLLLVEAAAYPNIVNASSKKTFPSVFIMIGDSDQFNGTAYTFGGAEKFLKEASGRLIPSRISYERNTPHAFQPENYKDAYGKAAVFVLNQY